MAGVEKVLRDRQVLLFVSSTFRDLQSERDELASQVFPRLREFCRARSVVFSDIDLRWGITVEQAESKQILPCCFHEIERCQPFFLGILGDRYGWTPTIGNDIPESFIESHPWIRECQGTSVTELEFLHGVFNREVHPTSVAFYSKYQRGESVASHHASPHHASPHHASPHHASPDEQDDEQDDARQKLAELKERIRRSGYRFREGFRDPRTLGQWVYEDLSKAIDAIFPIKEFDSGGNEARRHRSHAQQYRIGFSGRDDETSQISHFSKRSGRCVVVSGESGSGKAALLANWFCERIENKEGRLVQRGLLTRLMAKWQPPRDRCDIIRFGGLTDDSSSAADLARSIIREIRDRMKLQRTFPPDPATALAELPGWLEEGGRQADLQIVIAGLDRVESDPLRAMSWLPYPAPPGTSLVVSVTNQNGVGYTERLRKAGWHHLSLGPLSEAECCNAIVNTLAHYGKKVADPRAIVLEMASRLPRFLRVFLDGIRVYGEFGVAGERLEHRIDWYLQSTGQQDLYKRVINRWQDDYERERSGLVRDGLSLIAASHRGLEEMEILDLLGDENGRLPRYLWSPIQAAAENELRIAAGLVQIAAGPFREAIDEMFLTDSFVERSLREQLVAYFQSQPVSVRHVDELLWLLASLQRWDELAAWLSDPVHLQQFWSTHEYVLKNYCQRVCDSAGIRPVDLFQDALRREDVPLDAVIALCQLLLDMDEKKEVDRVTSMALKRVDELSDTDHRILLAMRASILLDDRPGEALDLLDREQTLCRRTGNQAALAACIGNQAVALRNQGKLDEAIARHAIEEAMLRDSRDLRLLAGSLSNQAQIHVLNRQYRQAGNLLKELEKLARTLRDTRLLGHCLESRGICSHAEKKYPLAIEQLRGAVGCFGQATDHHAQALCLGRLAATYYRVGDLDAAVECLDDGEAVAKKHSDTQLVTQLAQERQRLFDQFSADSC